MFADLEAGRFDWDPYKATTTNEVVETMKSRQIKKYNNLLGWKLNTHIDKEKVGKNLSQRLLTENKKPVTLNHAITSKEIPITDFIASTETTQPKHC